MAAAAPSWNDPPLAEGYLKKIRGFFQNRMRYFRLTKDQFAFYSCDQGQLISHVNRADISDVREVNSTSFEVTTTCSFGASGAKSMVLQASDSSVRDRWLSLLRNKVLFSFYLLHNSLFLERTCPPTSSVNFLFD